MWLAFVSEGRTPGDFHQLAVRGEKRKNVPCLKYQTLLYCTVTFQVFSYSLKHQGWPSTLWLYWSEPQQAAKTQRQFNVMDSGGEV